MYDDLKCKLEERFEYWGTDIRDEDVLDFSNDLRNTLDRSSSFKLYRYMPANYFNIRNIETQTIHLSPSGVMNDIYEGLPETSADIPYYKLQRLSDLAVMSCFSERNDNVLMWSHYANSHEGFCVEYDLKRIKNDPFQILNHLFPVIYRRERTIAKDIDSLIESHEDLNKAIAEHYVYDGKELLDDILPISLIKGLDWQYEQEWRIIYSKKQMYDFDEEQLYGGNLKFECISAVYLGYRIHPVIKQNLIEICQRLNNGGYEISLFQAKLEKTGYGIIFDAVSV